MLTTRSDKARFRDFAWVFETLRFAAFIVVFGLQAADVESATKSPPNLHDSGVTLDSVITFEELAGQRWGEFATAHKSSLDRHSECAAVGFVADGKMLAIRSRDIFGDHVPRLALFDMQSRAVKAVLSGVDEVYAISADAKTVAAVRDGCVLIYDAATGQLKHEMSALKGIAPMQIRFSRDGNCVAVQYELYASSTGDDRPATILTWNLADGRPVGPPIHDALQASCISLSADGKLLAIGFQDGTVKLWDATTGGQLASQQPTSSPVTRVVFSRDGNTLLTLDSGEKSNGVPKVQVWQVSPLLKVRGTIQESPAAGLQPDLPFPGRNLFDVAFDARTGDIVTLGSYGPVLTWWNPKTCQQLRAALLPSTGSQPSFDRISPDFVTLVTEDKDGKLGLWDIASYCNVVTTPAAILTHPVPVTAAAFSSDGSKVVSTGGKTGEQYGGLALWDVARPGSFDKPKKAAPNKSGCIFERLSISPRGDHVAALSGSTFSSVRPFVPTDYKSFVKGELMLTDSVMSKVTSIPLWADPLAQAISPDGRVLATTLSVDRIANQSEKAKTFYTAAYAKENLSASFTNVRVFIKLYDLENRKSGLTLGAPIEFGPFRPKAAMAFDHRGDRIAVAVVGSNAGTMFLRKMATGEDQSLRFLRNTTDVEFMPDDKRLAVLSKPDESAGKVNSITILNLENGVAEAEISCNSHATCMAIAPDGRTIAVGHSPMSGYPGLFIISIFDVQSQRLLKRLCWGAHERLANFQGKSPDPPTSGHLLGLRYSPSGDKLLAIEPAAIGLSHARVVVWSL